MQLGLTATPKRKDNVDTYAYFGDPVYIYSLKEGINDGFLTPFKVKEIATTVDEYVYDSDDYLVEGEIEADRRYTEPNFNRIIEIKQREEYRVHKFMEMIDQREKTLVFCATQDHALAVRDLINQMKTSNHPDYCVRVTAADQAIGDQFLREFQDNEKTMPTILTTSQKLSTGVDARNIRNIVLMRPINSMIEFKQIIGRGTRLYDGKDYFTIYDFVKAAQHFSDPEWDGEAINKPGDDHEPKEPRNRDDEIAEPPPDRPQKIIIVLSDGKARSIQSTVSTKFWNIDGKPISAEKFLENLFGTLPAFFKNEDELRAVWSNPDTRKELIRRLAEKGFGKEPLAEIQKIIAAEKSDLYDVLAYVAFALQPHTREERAARAKREIHTHFTDKQEAFLYFVLAQYVKEGVGELDEDKLSPLLKLKYRNALADATADLGNATKIRNIFVGFQKYLYQQLSC